MWLLTDLASSSIKKMEQHQSAAKKLIARKMKCSKKDMSRITEKGDNGKQLNRDRYIRKKFQIIGRRTAHLREILKERIIACKEK